MKIAGIYPQKISLDPKIQHAVSEPYGLEMILTVAKNEGHDVELFLPVKEENNTIVSTTEEDLVERIIDFQPDIAAFSMYTCQFPMGTRIASELKKRKPRVINVAGNRYPSFLADRIEEPFDFFIINEGEVTFKELIREMESSHDYANIKGLSFRKNGNGLFTGYRERISDLDSLPDAARFPIILKQVYRGISIPPISSEPHYAVVESSRGCYGVCKFCDNRSVWESQIKFRSPEKVTEELFKLKESGVDIFYFMDLNFTAVPKKALEICEEMEKQKVDVSWYCMSNIATVEGKEDLLYAMKEAGCYKIAWGIESTSDRSLELMDKRIGNSILKYEQAQGVLQKSLDVGLLNQGYYIIGFPWETADSIQKDAEGLRYLPLHQLNVGIFTPIPQSELHGEIKPEDLDPNLEHHDRNTLIYRHPSITKEDIKDIQKQMHSDFYESPEFIDRVKTSCNIDPRFRESFNQYFEFLGKDARV